MLALILKPRWGIISMSSLDKRGYTHVSVASWGQGMSDSALESCVVPAQCIVLAVYSMTLT